MRLPFLSVVLAAPFLFACGLGISQSGGGDAGPGPGPTLDGGQDAGPCGDTAPDFGCTAPCGGVVSPECVNGVWACPAVQDCPPPPVDAGCNGPFQGCPTIELCQGEYFQEICESGSWICALEGQCLDAGPDAPPDGPLDAPFDVNPPLFSCGAVACDPLASYCQIDVGGPVLVDGGTQLTTACIPLPTSCISLKPTCGCVQTFQGAGCGCIDTNGDVVVTCEVP